MARVSFVSVTSPHPEPVQEDTLPSDQECEPQVTSHLLAAGTLPEDSRQPVPPRDTSGWPMPRCHISRTPARRHFSKKRTPVSEEFRI